MLNLFQCYGKAIYPIFPSRMSKNLLTKYCLTVVDRGGGRQVTLFILNMLQVAHLLD